MILLDMKVMIAIKRVQMFFTKKYKREGLIDLLSYELNDLIHHYVPEIIDGLEIVEQCYPDTEAIFDEHFPKYRYIRYGVNSIIVDDSRPEFVQSLRRFNAQIQKAFLLEEHIDFENEQKLMEILRKD